MPSLCHVPPPGFRKYLRGQGFTLVELITIMIVISILATVAAVRYSERESFDARAFADQTANALRFAQKLAIAQNRPVYVRLNGSGFALCFNGTTCNTANDLVPAPAGGNSASAATKAACNNDTRWLCEGIPDNISLSVLPLVTGFYFDAQGRPFALGDAVGSNQSSFATLTLGINSSQPGASTNLKVEAESGYVHQ